MSTKIEILNSIENIKHEIISFLQEFIQAASPNPPGDTTAAAKVISELLEKYEMPFRWVSPQKTMPNIIGSINGVTPGRHLVLNGHIDVFPVSEEGWITPPWSGEIIEDKIYGRGSTDMKCGTSASIWTYIILNKFKTEFSGKLTLTCVSDEETLDRGEVDGLLIMKLKSWGIAVSMVNPQVLIRYGTGKRAYYG